MADQPKIAKFNKSLIYQFSLALLVVSTWVSGILFALYIISFYIFANTLNEVQAWNNVLPNLYSPEKPAAMTGMISHFFFGAVLLILGPIQFSQTIRKKFTNFHRWTGMFYTLSSFITGLGGIVFLGVWGASGGIPMLIGFGMYGALMMVCSVQTIRFALLREFNLHREWAIRLFALVLGSWIYRMGYGFIFGILDGRGITPGFTGPLDYFMDFAFFVIPLMVAEVVIKGNKSAVHATWKSMGSVLSIISALLIWQSSIVFLSGTWGVAISKLFL